MPLAKLTTSAPNAQAVAGRLLGALSRLLADRLHKPEQYVMTCLDAPARMTFAGSAEPSAYLELKSIGRFDSQQTRQLSAALCELIARELELPASRIYIEFADAQGYLWGHDGDTFE